MGYKRKGMRKDTERGRLVEHANENVELTNVVAVQSPTPSTPFTPGLTVPKETTTATSTVSGQRTRMSRDYFSGENEDEEVGTALREWLKGMDLAEHYDVFAQHGFATKMKALKAVTEEDLKEMGIAKMADRKTILLGVMWGMGGADGDDENVVPREEDEMPLQSEGQGTVTAGANVQNDDDEEESGSDHGLYDSVKRTAG